MTVHVGRAQDVIKAAQGGGSAPHVPIDFFRLFLRGKITGYCRIADADFDFCHFSDATVANAFHSLAKMAAKLRALLAADLVDDLFLRAAFSVSNAA